VPQSEGGKALDPEVLVRRVTAKLRGIIGEADLAEYGGRLIFAVCVRDIECWLLPLWAIDDKVGKTAACLELNTALDKKDAPTISFEAKKVPPYDNASRGYRKPAALHGQGVKNSSLKVFLDELGRRSIVLAPLE
jgi:hypothetical protein